MSILKIINNKINTYKEEMNQKQKYKNESDNLSYATDNLSRL